MSSLMTQHYTRAGDPTVKAHKHCGHTTGRSWDTGAATHGGMEVKCCRCGATTEVPYTMQTVPLKGHGPYITVRRAVYEWPAGWHDTESEP